MKVNERSITGRSKAEGLEGDLIMRSLPSPKLSHLETVEQAERSAQFCVLLCSQKSLTQHDFLFLGKLEES